MTEQLNVDAGKEDNRSARLKTACLPQNYSSSRFGLLMLLLQSQSNKDKSEPKSQKKDGSEIVREMYALKMLYRIISC